MDKQPLAVTIDAAADLLAVSRRTVYRLAQQGKFRVIRVTADAPRVVLADLERFISECETVASVYGDYLDGHSSKEIADKLNTVQA